MRKIAILLILLLLFEFPMAYSTNNNKGISGDKIDVLVFLNIGLDLSEVSMIKNEYYSAIKVTSDWKLIDSYLTEMRKEIFNYIKTETEPYFDSVTNYINSHGGRTVNYFVSIGAIEAEIPSNLLFLLEQNPLVKDAREPLKFKINLDVATKAVYADVWWNNGYNGSNDISRYLPSDIIKGVEVAILDTGIDMDNPYLADSIIAAKDFSDDNDPDDLNGHGTFVAGIIASNYTKYRGVAAGVNLINAKCLNKNGIGSEAWIYLAIEWALTSVDDSPEVINSSLGTNQLEPDGESSFTRNIDKYIDLYDVAWVTAAGNKDNTTGLQLNVPGDYFNGLTVGAVNDAGTVDRSDDKWATFSCIGPTSDGRVKPDIVAPGEAITSTTNLGSFDIDSGTSFATPIVAGSLALVAPLLIMRFGKDWYLAARALLINSADDWSATAPDPYTGWGYLNLLNAWNEKNYVLIGEMLPDDTVPISIFVENNSLLKVTVTWNRHYDENAGDFYELSLINMTLRDTKNVEVDYTIYESKNVIQLVYRSNETGYYYLYLTANFIDPSLGSETFALAANQPFYLGLIASNLTIKIDSPSSIYDREILDIQVKVRNAGNETINQIKLNITVTDGLTLFNQSLPIDIGLLAPGQEVHKAIYLKPTNIGPQLIKVIIYYPYDNDIVLNMNYTRVNIIDDDTSKPTISSVSISGSPIIFRSLKITVEASDESGISSVIVYYKVDDPNVSDENYDGFIQLHPDEPGNYVGDIMVPISWIGKNIYFIVKVVDNDNDHENDTEASLSNVLSIHIPLEINIIILLIPVIFAIVLIIALKTRK